MKTCSTNSSSSKCSSWTSLKSSNRKGLQSGTRTKKATRIHILPLTIRVMSKSSLSLKPRMKRKASIRICCQAIKLTTRVLNTLLQELTHLKALMGNHKQCKRRRIIPRTVQIYWEALSRHLTSFFNRRRRRRRRSSLLRKPSCHGGSTLTTFRKTPLSLLR